MDENRTKRREALLQLILDNDSARILKLPNQLTALARYMQKTSVDPVTACLAAETVTAMLSGLASEETKNRLTLADHEILSNYAESTPINNPQKEPFAQHDVRLAIAELGEDLAESLQACAPDNQIAIAKATTLRHIAEGYKKQITPEIPCDTPQGPVFNAKVAASILRKSASDEFAPHTAA